MNCRMCTPGGEGSHYVCNECLSKMRQILREIAYPRRGTPEETWNIDDVAVMIQTRWTLDQLEGY
jgi:hypothetical protein